MSIGKRITRNAKKSNKKSNSQKKSNFKGSGLKLKPLVDKVDANGNVEKKLSNFYTGKKLNPLYSGIGITAIGVGQFSSFGKSQMFYPITASKKNVEQGGAPEIMLYDGVGQQSAPAHLNANGNIVFGLHNQRRG